MKVRIFISGLALVAAGTIFTACDGEVGPQGPKGDTGAVGAVGAPGAKGDKGDAGTSGANGLNNGNIIVRSLEGGSISAGTNGAGYSWSFGSDLSADIVESSAAYMYLQMPSGAWYAMPGSILNAENIYQTFALRVTIEENRTLSRFRLTRTEGAGTLTFTAARIVLVPKAAGARLASLVDYTNYEAVKQYYNLTD